MKITRKSNETMNKFNSICCQLSQRLSNLPYQDGDMGDIGNEIGIIIAKYFVDNNDAWDKECFVVGLNHGISLTDGTHDT